MLFNLYNNIYTNFDFIFLSSSKFMDSVAQMKFY